MIKAIIFDCFGVLVGSGFENTYRTAGGDPVADRPFIENTLGQANMGLISDDDFRKAMAGQLNLQLEQWQQAVRRAEQPDEDLLNYIKELRKNYKTAVLSNANSGTVARKIGEQWVRQCFDEVVVSAEVGLVKPDPAIYLMAADRLGVKPEECVFIDDIKMFTEAGQKLGMKVILYQGLDNLKKELELLLNL